MSKPYSYERFSKILALIYGDLAILSGDVVGPSNTTWQDVTGTCACNLRVAASMLDAARAGNCIDAAVFPSPAKIVPDLAPSEAY